MLVSACSAHQMEKLTAYSNQSSGEKHYSLRQHDVAEFLLKKNLLAYPGNTEALRTLAWSQFFQRKYDKALVSFQQIYSSYPDDGNTLVGIGWAYMGLRNYEKAVAAFTQAVPLPADAYQVHKGIAFAYYKMLDMTQAMEHFRQIYSEEELDELAIFLRDWKADDESSNLEVIAPHPENPSLFTLPVERPRYRSLVWFYQLTANSERVEQGWQFLRQGKTNKAIQEFESVNYGNSLDAANGLAWSYLKKSRIREAYAIFKNMLKNYPKFKGALDGLAELEKMKREKAEYADYYYAQSKRKIALAKFNDFASNFPDWTYPYVNIGEIYAQENDMNAAYASFKKALEIEPDNARALNGMDGVYAKIAPELLAANQKYREKDYVVATRLYLAFIHKAESRASIPALPDMLAEANNNLGWSYFYKNQYDLAVTRFQNAAAHKQYKLDATKGAGFAYYFLEDYKNAAKLLAQADQMDPNQPEIAYKLDMSILRSAGFKKAEAYFKSAIKQYPLRASPYMGLGWIYYSKGDADLAVEHFLKAISLDPDYALTKEFSDVLDQERFGWQVYNHFAWTYYQKHNYLKALALFKVSLSRNHAGSETMKGLGYTYYKLGKYWEAIEYLQRCMAFNSNPHPVSEIVDNEDAIAAFALETSARSKMAWSYYNLGDYEKALAIFQEELERRPNWPDLHTGLGWTHLKMQRTQEAWVAFTLAIKHQSLNMLAVRGLSAVKQETANKKLESQTFASKTQLAEEHLTH